jgi:hypothetical protein
LQPFDNRLPKIVFIVYHQYLEFLHGSPPLATLYLVGR